VKNKTESWLDLLEKYRILLGVKET